MRVALVLAALALPGGLAALAVLAARETTPRAWDRVRLAPRSTAGYREPAVERSVQAAFPPGLFVRALLAASLGGTGLVPMLFGAHTMVGHGSNEWIAGSLLVGFGALLASVACVAVRLVEHKIEPVTAGHLGSFAQLVGVLVASPFLFCGGLWPVLGPAALAFFAGAALTSAAQRAHLADVGLSSAPGD